MSEIVSNHRIQVWLLGSGYGAVHVVDVTDEAGTYPDVQQTGVGRYRTYEEATIEARMWAESIALPFEGGPDYG